MTNTFPKQILSFRSALLDKIKLCSSKTELAKIFLIDYSTILCTFDDICTALMIFLTLLVTSASVESSFSKLKMIKNYLRSIIGQQRLSDLANNYRKRSCKIAQL